MMEEDFPIMSSNNNAEISAQLIPIIDKLKLHWQGKLHDEQIASQLELYIPTMLGFAEKVESEHRKSGIEELQSFINGSKRLLLLLGDSGSGKSLFSQWLVDDLWRHSKGCVPIFIHLPAQKIKKGFLEKYLKKQCRLSDEQIELFRVNGKLFLILDAYDELKAKKQRKKPISVRRVISLEYKSCYFVSNRITS